MTHDTGCNQGRVGMASVNASRAILGLSPLPEEDPQRTLAPLWQRSGGARVSLHYESDESADGPLYTPESFSPPVPRALTIVVVAFAIPMVLAAIDYFR